MKPIIAGCSILIVIIFFGTFWYYSFNFPYADEFFSPCLDYLNRFESASFTDKIKLIFQPHYEHRIALPRLVYLLVYRFNGVLDFRIVMAIGNLFLVGMLLLYYAYFRKKELSLAYFIPIPLLLFQCSTYETSYWALTSIEKYGVLFFSLLTLYFLEEKRILLAILSACVATFTDLNGILIFLPGIFILLLTKRRNHLIYWSVAMFICLGIYFFHFSTTATGRPSILDTIFGFFPIISLDFFTFLGNIFEFFPANGFGLNKVYFIFPFLSGFCALIIWLTSIYNYFRNKRTSENIPLFLVAGILFFLVTAAAFAVSRASLGALEPFNSRYKINAINLLILCYLLVLNQVKLPKYMPIIFAVSAIIFNFSLNFRFSYEVINHQKKLLVDAYNFKHNQSLLGQFEHFRNHSLEDCIKEKIYRLPELKNIEDGLSQQKADTSVHFSVLNISDYGIQIQNDSYLQTTFHKNDGIYVTLQSQNHTYLFKTIQRKSSFSQFLKTIEYYRPGYQTSPIFRNVLQKGNYNIGLLEIKNNHPSYSISKTIISI